MNSIFFPPNCWYKKLGEPEGPRPKWRKIVRFWIPRRFVSSNDVDVPAVLRDLDAKIEERGFVLWDGQILSKPLREADLIGLKFEGSTPVEIPPHRPWQGRQRRFFGLDEPYQMAEEPDAYSCSSLEASICEPYLRQREGIIGLVHGARDRRFFYCPCHNASVVYTTMHRLVCMSCGAMHAVLADPLIQEAEPALSGQDWSQLFDADGSQREADVGLQIVEFQDLEHADLLWSTCQWEEAVDEFTFYARSSPEEIDAAIRGTERDPSILLEVGFKPVDIPPPPAFHVIEESVDIHPLENAEHAFVDGVEAYFASFHHPTQLLRAIPDLFRAIELTLKTRLQQMNSAALQDRPNGPKVLARLEENGIRLEATDVEVIDRLRRFRNEVQHDSARFNYREGLRTCRGALVFMERFLRSEFSIWIGDAFSVETRMGLLAMSEVAEPAQHVLSERLERIREDPEASIETCGNCGEESLVRAHRSTGASCIYCGHLPTYRGDASTDKPAHLLESCRGPRLSRNCHADSPKRFHS